MGDKIILFIILRILDLVSTYIGITYFELLEGNGVQAVMIHKFGFCSYSILNLWFSITILRLILDIENRFIRDGLLYGFMVLNFIVVLVNFFLIFSA